jgi:hypothetical protein
VISSGLLEEEGLLELRQKRSCGGDTVQEMERHQHRQTGNMMAMVVPPLLSLTPTVQLVHHPPHTQVCQAEPLQQAT